MQFITFIYDNDHAHVLMYMDINALWFWYHYILFNILINIILLSK